MPTLKAPESEQFLDAGLLFAAKFWRRLGRFLPMFGLLWIAIGWCTISMFADSFADGAKPLGLLIGTAAATTDHQKFGWFFVYCQLLAMVALLAWIRRGLSAAEAALERASPLVAAAFGDPPRCRICRAPLTLSGAARRCASCGADHLVWSAGLTKDSGDVDEKELPARPSLRAALLSASRRIAFWPAMALVFNFGGILLALILSAFVPPRPWLYLLPVAWGALVSSRFLRNYWELSAIEQVVLKKPSLPVAARAATAPQTVNNAAQTSSHADIASARCTSCGGNVPLQFSQPLVCPFCGAKDPIPPSLAMLLATVRERIARRATEQQQFAGEQQVFTQKSFDYAERYIPLFIVLSLLMAPLYGAVIEAMKPPGAPLLHFLLGLVPASTDDAQYAWSFFFAATFNLVLTVALPAFGFVKSKELVLSARAIAPIAPGAPPRCRCCLAELPAEGTTRRCAYCGADHLVLDDRYRAQEASLDEAIAAAIAEGQRSLRKSLLRSMGYVSWALALIILLFPVAFFSAVLPLALLQVTQPAPWLLILPIAGLSAALLAYVRAWRRLKATAFTEAA